jgi:hypothetical protein
MLFLILYTSLFALFGKREQERHPVVSHREQKQPETTEVSDATADDLSG